jgi:hypothetical protein
LTGVVTVGRMDRDRAGTAIAVGGVCWVLAVVLIAWVWLGKVPPLHVDDPVRRAAIAADAASWGVLLALVLGGVPMVLTGIAIAGRRALAAVLFGILSVVCAIPALGLAVAIGHEQSSRPPVREPLPSNYCGHFSGSDQQCPGG